MDFRQLEAFCAIVEWESFSEAARKLYITQPTISNHLRSLEQELNTQLITRTTKSLTVTADGKHFYEHARDILNLKEKTLREFSRTKAHHIAMGASSIPSAYILPEILAAFKQKNPETTFEITQSDSMGIIEQLQSGVIDLGITGTPFIDEHFHCSPVYNDELVLVLPDTEYYRSILSKDIQEILIEPFIIREDGSGTRRETIRFLESIGLKYESLNISAKMNDLEAIIHSVSAGLGISVLSAKVTEKVADKHDIIILPLGCETVQRSYYVIYRKNVTGNPFIVKFIEFIQSYLSR